ncbi:MAG TPA: sugar transferase [Dehalococcoidia bacterium]|nr:sugar transferase [Dehalococcoidia bacterium]
MARSSRVLRLALAFAVGDLLLINVAFLIAYRMRYGLELGGEVSIQNFVALSDYFPIQIALSLVLIAAYWIGGLYRRPLRRSLLDQAFLLLSATSLGMMVVLTYAFFARGYAYSRLIYFFAGALIFVGLIGARILVRFIWYLLRRRGIGVRRTLIAGGGTLARMAMHVIATEPGTDYRVCGFVSEGADGDFGRFKCLGALEEIGDVVARYEIDEVVIALPANSHERVLEILDHCKRQQISFKLIPDLYEMSLHRVDLDELRGIPLIGIKEAVIQGPDLVVKRALDIVIAALALVLFSPLWLLIALLIKIDSPGPIFFRQVRVGRGATLFGAYKFRSMRVNAESEIDELWAQNEASGPLFKMRRDPRVTRIGRFLRRTSLDEVPQFYNVLRGEMSLVGPRPPIPAEVEQYEDWHKKRLQVAPGLTGLWQVSGRSELPFDEMVMMDLFYIENWSLALDLKILIRTIPAVLGGSGAY